MSQEQPKDEIKILPPLKEVTDFIVLAKDHRVTIYNSTDKQFCNVEGCDKKAEFTVGIIIPKNWLDQSSEKELIPALHYTCKNHRTYFVDKIQEVAEQLVKYKQEADELLTKKGALLKNEREKLKGNLSHIFQQINSNLPFLHQCMQEAVDNTVSQAKGEVDSYLTSAISNLGIEAFQKLNLPTDSDQVLIDISEKEE